MDYFEIESERLVYRKYRQEDYWLFYAMLSNLENMKYRSSEPKNTEDVQKYLSWGIKCAEQKPCINYRYADKEQSYKIQFAGKVISHYI